MTYPEHITTKPNNTTLYELYIYALTLTVFSRYPPKEVLQSINNIPIGIRKNSSNNVDLIVEFS